MTTENRFLKLAADAKTRITEIIADEAARKVEQGAVLIDVREAEEFAKGQLAECVKRKLSRG